MSDQLAAAAQAMGVPEAIVERSAHARAAVTGQSYEDVIAAWAGGEAVAAAPPPPASEPADTPADAAPEETDAPAAEPAPAVPAAAAEDLDQVAAAVSRAPAPERVTPEESLQHPVVVTVPTVGIKERTGFSMPAWLGMLLLVIPAFGLIHLALGGGGECGVGTELRVDRVTGLVENCDGSPFEGRGAGGGGTDFIALGETQYATCAGCHGPQGGGSGAFPALTGVVNTFGACADHIEWVTLGSAAFDTYGDSNKKAQPGMPGFGGSLSEEQIAAVVAFERVRFGGGNPDEVLVDCGLVEGEGADGEDGAATEEGATPEDTGTENGDTTDTTSGAEATASH